MTPESPLALRPFTAADAGLLAAWAADPRITRFVGDGRPWDAARVEQRVTEALAGRPLDEPGAARWFVVEEPGAAAPCALAVATRRSDGLEIGYWVAVEHWGRGVGRATARLLLDRLFPDGPPATETVFARVDPDNHASVAVLVGVGMRRVGAADGTDRYELPTGQPSGSADVPSP